MSVQQGSKGPDLSALKIDEEARSGGGRGTWGVRAGRVRARLDDSDSQKRLAAARAALEVARASVPVLEVNLANAERELARQQDLEKEGVSSVQALDLARTTRDGLNAQLAAAHEEVGQAHANLATAEQDVENCTVRAPFAGIVGSKGYFFGVEEG